MSQPSVLWTARYDIDQTMPERTSSRHWWARIIEGSDYDDDQVPHPYTNWGFTNRLDFVLAQLRERNQQ